MLPDRLPTVHAQGIYIRLIWCRKGVENHSHIVFVNWRDGLRMLWRVCCESQGYKLRKIYFFIIIGWISHVKKKDI